MYDDYLKRYSFIKDGRKTTLILLSHADVFLVQSWRKRKKEFEKELKKKPELGEKLEKNQREKKKTDVFSEKLNGGNIEISYDKKLAALVRTSQV